MTSTVILIKYGEIALRGGNRKIHENILLNNIKSRLLAANIDALVRKDQGRLFVELSEESLDEGMKIVSRIFGVAGLCICLKTDDNSIENIKTLAERHIKANHPRGGTFKVEASRADKNYPLNSQELAAELGGYLAEKLPELSVKMREPDIKLFVEIRSFVYIYSQTVKGLGGLPAGTGGKAALLLSGGFDSPVAGYMVARRGVSLICCYFHSPPYTSEQAKEKVVDLARRLSLYAGEIKLYIINFTDTQLYLNENVPEAKLTLFLKRAMLRIANLIADNENVQALVTGDSIGQVASQTMHALTATDSAAALPVLRPLAAMDKLDIMKIAENIGTAEISLRPFADCCTVFVPKHPELKPSRDAIEKIEGRLKELPRLFRECVDGAEVCLV